MHKIAVYLGPSLDRAAARAILDAEYLSPIKRGDLARLGASVEAVGIVDGEFYQSLAVSPKEILPLLERGVRVYGSSSMGALRAVETSPYGMTGIGTVFEWYRDGVIDADDEVALTYDPEMYRPCSVPLVNIRATLLAAVEAGVLSVSEAEEAVRKLKDIYFPSRTYAMLVKICPEVKGFLENGRRDVKRDDAAMLLRAMAG